MYPRLVLHMKKRQFSESSEGLKKRQKKKKITCIENDVIGRGDHQFIKVLLSLGADINTGWFDVFNINNVFLGHFHLFQMKTLWKLDVGK